MLSGSVDDTGGGAAGSIYMKLILTNQSGTPCILNGYPGVSLVGYGNGTQVGLGAERDATKPSTGPIHLVPGASASAVLKYTQAGNYAAADCRPAQADGFRVYPPSATDALFISHPLTGCTSDTINLLRIGAFAP